MIVTNNFVVRCDGVATFLRSVQSVHTMIPVSPGQCPCNFRTSAYLTIRIFWKMSDLIVFTTCSAEASSTSANFSSSVQSTSAIFEVAQIRSFFCSSWANLGGVRFRPFEIGGTLGPPGTEKVGGPKGGVPNIYRFVFFRHILPFVSLFAVQGPPKLCVWASLGTQTEREDHKNDICGGRTQKRANIGSPRKGGPVQRGPGEGRSKGKPRNQQHHVHSHTPRNQHPP